MLSEKEMLGMLRSSKKVLLIEPEYKTQYPPLGLMKISSYIKKHGGDAVYSRNEITGDFDLICITTLFTNEAKKVIKSIRDIKESLFLSNVPILVGGIFASLMPEYITDRYNVNIFSGCSIVLDNQEPDYSLNFKLKRPWDNAAVTFTTRGCPNKCGYCMVWRMEPRYHIIENWELGFEKDYPLIVIQDNNFLKAPIEHIEAVCKKIIDTKKSVIFNNALDVKLIDDDRAELLSKISYSKNGYPGLRFAFDRMTDDGYYQRACKLMLKYLKKPNLSNIGLTYVLFNFNDKPKDAIYRATECWKYKSVPYLMRFRPLDLTTKQNNYIGKYWTKNLVKAFKTWGEVYGFNTGDKNFYTWIRDPSIDLTKQDMEALFS